MTDDRNIALKVALVARPDRALDGWQAMVIDRLHRDPRFRLAGRAEGAPRQGRALLPPVARGLLKCEQFLVRSRILPYDTAPAQKLLAALPPLRGGAGEDAADVALVLGPGTLPDGQLALARFGEWSLSFAGAADPGGVCMTREVRQAPRVGVELIGRSKDCPGGHVLRKTSYNPKPGAGLTGAFVAEKSVLFLLRALADLAAGRPPQSAAVPPCARPERPGPGAVSAYGLDMLCRAGRKFSERRRERAGRPQIFWQLAAGTGSITGLEPRRSADITRKAFIMADPFLFDHDGTLWLFYEAMDAGSKRAWIEAGRLEEGRLLQPRKVLQCSYHLSFPFVFRHGDEIYMMPETQQSRRLEVWRATRFPDEWVLHATAFEGQFPAESILFRHDDDSWWLLSNLSDHHAFQEHSSELYLFRTDGPDLTSIVPHPRNPVVIGSGRARNAGAVIRQGGRLFRPSQNNSHGIYGYGLNIMEITRLDETAYEERLLHQFTPADRPGCLGMHHLSVAGDRYVIDWAGREERR